MAKEPKLFPLSAPQKKETSQCTLDWHDFSSHCDAPPCTSFPGSANFICSPGLLRARQLIILESLRCSDSWRDHSFANIVATQPQGELTPSGVKRTKRNLASYRQARANQAHGRLRNTSIPPARWKLKMKGGRWGNAIKRKNIMTQWQSY